MKPELDLFEYPAVQTGVSRTEEVALKPLAALNSSGQLEFLSMGKTDCYRDLSNMYLRLRVKLLADAVLNTALAEDANVGTSDNIGHTLFKSAKLYLQNTLITSGDENYSYRAYIESLLNFSQEAAYIHLEPSGRYIDSLVATKNPGLDKRKALFAKSSEVELIIRPKLDFAHQNKWLIGGIDMRVILTLNSPEFYIMAKDTDTSSIKIMDATLFVPHMTIAPQILLAHETVLQKQNAIYPYKRINVMSYSISPGSQLVTIDNIVLGRLPDVLLFTTVANANYCAKRSLNPLHLRHFNLKSFVLWINGVQVPSQPIEMDFSDADHPICARAYDSLIKETQNWDKSHQINWSAFLSSKFMLAQDLTASKSYQAGTCINPAIHGTVSIELRYDKPLEEAITAIIYTEYSASVEIDKDRNVYNNY